MYSLYIENCTITHHSSSFKIIKDFPLTSLKHFYLYVLTQLDLCLYTTMYLSVPSEVCHCSWKGRGTTCKYFTPIARSRVTYETWRYRTVHYSLVHARNYLPFCRFQKSVVVPGRVVGRRARALHLLQGAGLSARLDAAGLRQVGGVVVQVSGLAERRALLRPEREVISRRPDTHHLIFHLIAAVWVV